MHWLFLLMALGAFVLAFSTPHVWLLILSLLVAVLLMLIWARGWYASRIHGGQRDGMHIIDPAELRRLRELAESRKTAATAGKREPQA